MGWNEATLFELLIGKKQEIAMNRPSTKDDRPDRKNLGPTGLAHIHPKLGNPMMMRIPMPVPSTHLFVGPTPTDDPRNEADKQNKVIEKKRAQTSPD